MTNLMIASIVTFAVGSILDTYVTDMGIRKYGMREGSKFPAWLHDRIGIVPAIVKEGLFAWLVVVYIPEDSVKVVALMAGGLSQIFVAIRNWRMIERVRKAK